MVLNKALKSWSKIYIIYYFLHFSILTKEKCQKMYIVLLHNDLILIIFLNICKTRTKVAHKNVIQGCYTIQDLKVKSWHTLITECFSMIPVRA